MADFTSSPTTAGYAPDSAHGYAVGSGPKTLTTLTNIAGAVVSLALVAGIGVWGYKLLVRDVTGIPVVRAIEGEIRVRPDEPGGELARHQGLSVNVVAAEGSAGRPADQLRLAPRQMELQDEDQPVQVAMVAAKTQGNATPAVAHENDGDLIDASAAIRSGNVQDLVAQLTNGVAPLSGAGASGDSVDAAVAMALADTSVQPKVVKAVLNAPGVRNSLRPRPPQSRAIRSRLSPKRLIPRPFPLAPGWRSLVPLTAPRLPANNGTVCRAVSVPISKARTALCKRPPAAGGCSIACVPWALTTSPMRGVSVRHLWPKTRIASRW